MGKRHALYPLDMKPEALSAYRERNDNLSELGYRSYQEYLKSEDWKKIRIAFLAKHPDCLTCDRNASQVHHLSYDFRTLLGIDDSYIVSLCEYCHEEIEFHHGGKRNLKGANKALRHKAAKVKKARGWLSKMRHIRDEMPGKSS